MLAVVRVNMKNDSEELWNFIDENHLELKRKFNNDVEILYLTKIARHKDTSILLHTKQPEVFGDFVANAIAPIKDINDLWMFNLFKLKFFAVENGKTDLMKRYIVNLKCFPNKMEEVYNSLTALSETSLAAPVYVAYTFHLFGDCLTFSLLADDEENARKYVDANLGRLTSVPYRNMYHIEKQKRLVDREWWGNYIRSRLITNQKGIYQYG